MSRARELAEAIAEQFFGARVIRADTYQPTAEQFAVLNLVRNYLRDADAIAEASPRGDDPSHAMIDVTSDPFADGPESPPPTEAEVAELQKWASSIQADADIATPYQLRRAAATGALLSERSRDKAELAREQRMHFEACENWSAQETRANQAEARVAAALAAVDGYEWPCEELRDDAHDCIACVKEALTK